jgi:alpha-mannosidase
MNSGKAFTAFIISETHWDRAWYLPFQTFRLRLVRLIDQLIDVLSENPDYRSFLLDGQMLPIEDYLEIRPKKRQHLKKLVQDGRLFVGPWYALADEFLVSPEALIRNLLIGIRRGEELGGTTLVGYIPDAFGHIRQLPQIFQGFEIDSAIFWRGLGDEGETLGDEFSWQAPNGSTVLAVHLRHGYFNATHLGYPIIWGDPSAFNFNLEKAVEKLGAAVESLKPHNKSGVFLLMNGIDHADIEPQLPVIILKANQKFPDIQFKHGSLPEYLIRVRAGLNSEVPAFTGELNRSRYGFGLHGVYSSRIYLHQANERAQTLLEGYTEPLSTWTWMLGEPYPAEFIDLAWRTLLKNHPHDDICGCSIDVVHRENMVGFEQVRQIGEPLARDAYRILMANIDRTAQPGTPFVIYNPVASSRTETAELALIFDADDPVVDGFQLVDSVGDHIPFQTLTHEKTIRPEVGKIQDQIRVRIAATLKDLPGCGYRVLFAQPCQTNTVPDITDPIQTSDSGMENQFLRVEIKPDGSLNLLDKRTGQQFENLLVFIDDEDIGDEYDYSPAPNPEPITTQGQPANIQILESGPLQVSYQIEQTLHLPCSLTPDRQGRSSDRLACELTTILTLRHNDPHITIQTRFENLARDHRLRVLFPTDIQTKVAAADGHFDVIERPIAIPECAEWDQPPVPTRHQRYFVDLSDGEVGLVIFNRGLPEYEIISAAGQNTIAVTLLRAVGYLSQAGLTTRPKGHAGPADISAPEAQCLGTHTFEYAIAPHSGEWESVYALAYRFRTPMYIRNGLESSGNLPPVSFRQEWAANQVKIVDRRGYLPVECSFLSIEPEIITLSAVKRSENGQYLIIRIYNPTMESIQTQLTLFLPIQKAFEVNLNETILDEIPIRNEHSIELALGAKTIKTIAICKE